MQSLVTIIVCLYSKIYVINLYCCSNNKFNAENIGFSAFFLIISIIGVYITDVYQYLNSNYRLKYCVVIMYLKGMFLYIPVTKYWHMPRYQ